MATKPSEQLHWAESGVTTKPNASKIDDGFVGAERPPAQFLDWILNLLGLWTQYLGDGDLTGNHSITGDLLVTGNEHVTGDLTVDGSINHGSRVKTLAAVHSVDSFSVPSPATHTRSGGNWTLAASATKIYYPVDIIDLETVTAYSVGVIKNTSVGTIACRLVSFDGGGTETTESPGGGGESDATNAGGAAALGVGGLSVAAAGKQLYVRITPTGNVTGGADVLGTVTVTYKTT